MYTNGQTIFFYMTLLTVEGIYRVRFSFFQQNKTVQAFGFVRNIIPG